MIRYLAALSIALPAMVSAQGIPQSKVSECAGKGALAGWVVTYHEQGLSPQQTFGELKKQYPNPKKYPAQPVFEDSYLKRVVNAVYFDDRLQGIPSNVLSQQVSDACMFPPKQYQPLK